ncbi:MAG: hypothetical protein DHS20C11_28600 [Lysobacteraceae bacterium]|nr:MAG: hypothetical protein DHS20C11_28600 [Xanthomonadaceae bacterium]
MFRSLFKKKHPPAVDARAVGKYPALTKSGGGFFYDDVLEYRVWVHPERGGENLQLDQDYFFAFATYSEALNFSEKTRGAETPLVLVRQLEYINEPEPGVFEHQIGERITEWQPEWLQGNKRLAKSIGNFLGKNA